MKGYFILSFCFMLFIFNSECKSVYFRTRFDQNGFYQCFKKSGYDEIVVLYIPDTERTSFVNVIQAKNAGLKVHIAYPPCRNQTPKAVSRSLRTVFGTHMIEQAWIFGIDRAYPQNPQCDWTKYSNQSNCEYAKQLSKALKQDGFKGNVVANGLLWMALLGSLQACPEIADMGAKLWWIPLQNEQDNQPDFERYKKFGGWKTPSMKLYNGQYICNEQVFESYYQD